MKSQKFDELVRFLKETYENKVPFHSLVLEPKFLLEEDKVFIKINKKENLIGNYKYEMLHGGVIASIMDITGGAIVSIGLIKKAIDEPEEQIKEKIFKIGTIDLRVDFLRPAQGKQFLATGHILRIGNRIAAVHTFLYDEQNILISSGAATYSTG